jgi:hypothetical protein
VEDKRGQGASWAIVLEKEEEEKEEEKEEEQEE